MRFKDKLAKYVFRKATEKKRAKREAIALSNAKSIGILYDATHQSQVNIVAKFVESLKIQGKAVTIFGFYNKKKLPQNISNSKSNEIISRTDLNWYGIPKKNAYAMMANEPFDVLLSLYTWHCVPLLIISASSKAKFRIGKYFSDAINCFDFMLNIDNNAPLENFLTQIEDFSTKFKK
jgi:hypothetical protein